MLNKYKVFLCTPGIFLILILLIHLKYESENFPKKQITEIKLQLDKNKSFDNIDQLDNLENLSNDFDGRANEYITYTLNSGDSLQKVFLKFGLPISDLNQIKDKLPINKKIYPGQLIEWKQSHQNSKIIEFNIYHNQSEIDNFEWKNNYYQYRKILKRGVKIDRYVKGYIENNFYQSAIKKGLNATQIHEIGQALSHKINLSKDVKKNDQFIVLMEEEILKKNIISSRVKAVLYEQNNTKIFAFKYNNKFYNEKGFRNLSKFLPYPTKKLYRISSHFNPRRLHPVTKRITPHRGIDYAMPTGTRVHSVGHGIVIASHKNRYSGNIISIKHTGGYITKYLHLHKRIVKKGQRVKKGQLIGLSGNTGISTGPHLHFEILKHNKHLDPYRVSKMIKQQVQNRKKFYAQTSPIKQKLIGELENG